MYVYITSTNSGVELSIRNRNLMIHPQTQTPKTAPDLDQRLGQNTKRIFSNILIYNIIYKYTIYYKYHSIVALSLQAGIIVDKRLTEYGY